jgi:hypothetical protein
MASSSSMCNVMYSPHIRCGEPIDVTYNGKPLCKFHFTIMKTTEECPICFEYMNSNSKEIMLKCGHSFHKDCLGQCHETTCPMCRQQLTSDEAIQVFTPTVILPMIETIYNMPSSTTKDVIDSFKLLTILGTRGRWYTLQAKELLECFVKVCSLTEVMIENRQTAIATHENLEREDSAYYEIEGILSHMSEILLGNE